MAGRTNRPIRPTNDQAQAAIDICNALSNLYRPIIVFRYDDYNRVIYILVIKGKDETEILIHSSGFWRFI